jgi:hypothetical protein
MAAAARIAALAPDRRRPAAWRWLARQNLR